MRITPINLEMDPAPVEVLYISDDPYTDATVLKTELTLANIRNLLECECVDMAKIKVNTPSGKIVCEIIFDNLGRLTGRHPTVLTPDNKILFVGSVLIRPLSACAGCKDKMAELKKCVKVFLLSGTFSEKDPEDVDNAYMLTGALPSDVQCPPSEEVTEREGAWRQLFPRKKKETCI